MILITTKVGNYKPADALWQWVKRASLLLTRWVTWGRSRYSHLVWFFGGYNPIFILLGSWKEPAACYPDVSVVDKGNEVWIVGAHRGVQTSSARLCLNLVREQRPWTCKHQRNKKTKSTRKFHFENGLTNLLFDYDLCDQLLGLRRRREIRQRGRLFARRLDRGRSLWFPNLRTCRSFLTFVVTYWFSLSFQRSY